MLLVEKFLWRLYKTLLEKRPGIFILFTLLIVLYGAWRTPPFQTSPPPQILGQTEYCISCHSGISGLGVYHAPSAIGCASCHLGDTSAVDKAAAHVGIILIPGNLSDAAQTCGASGCHEDAPAKVENGLMNTMAGVVRVDRQTFGVAQGVTDAAVSSLSHDPADSHLRTLCASCHIGAVKEELGPIDGESRGGGCNACHLVYAPEDEVALNQYSAANHHADAAVPPTRHPALSVNVSDDHCFGCHSRSGRISLSFNGWAEIIPPAPVGSAVHTLEDGRTVQHKTADVHAARMGCTDCHTMNEVMGDGKRYASKHEALRTRCTDCHTNDAGTVGTADLSPDEQRVLIVRDAWDADASFIQTVDGTALLGTRVTSETVEIHSRKGGEKLFARAPSKDCENNAHERLTCEACHSAWAPQCIGCHTEYDPDAEGYDLYADAPQRGDWIETGSDYRAEAPTLGIRHSRTGDEEIVPFVPGMILTVDTSRHPEGDEPFFRRLFAPLAPHTITREARSCESCHRNAVALGYGKGALRLANDGQWRFSPQGEILEDGLPDDAWIGFMEEPGNAPTLHEGTRPFTRIEQTRVLNVGACLECHQPDSAVMRRYLADPERNREKLGPQCTRPAAGE